MTRSGDLNMEDGLEQGYFMVFLSWMLHGICHFWLVLLFVFVGCQEFISWYATFSFSEDAFFFLKCGETYRGKI